MSARDDISERDREIRALLDRLHTLGMRDAREAALLELECCIGCGVYITPDDVQMSAWARRASKINNGPVCLACVTEHGVCRCDGCRGWRLGDTECCDAETIDAERALRAEGV